MNFSGLARCLFRPDVDGDIETKERPMSDTNEANTINPGASRGESSDDASEERPQPSAEDRQTKADDASAGEASFWSTRRILVTVVFLAFVVFVTYRVLNQFAGQPYMEVPHGDHVHYVPKDRDEAVPLSDFPTQPPAENERILPDGRVVQTGPPVQP